MSEQPPEYGEERPPPRYEDTQPALIEAPVPYSQHHRRAPHAVTWGKDVEIIAGRCGRHPDAPMKVACPACNQVMDTRVKGPPLPKEPLHPPKPPSTGGYDTQTVVKDCCCGALMMLCCIATCCISCCCFNPDTIRSMNNKDYVPAPTPPPKPQGGPWVNSYTHWCSHCGIRLGSYRREIEQIEDCPYIKTLDTLGNGVETPLERSSVSNAGEVTTRSGDLIQLTFKKSDLESESGLCEYSCQDALEAGKYILSIRWPRWHAGEVRAIPESPDISLYICDEASRTCMGSSTCYRGESTFDTSIRMGINREHETELKPLGSEFCAEYAAWQLSAGGWVWWKWMTEGTSLRLIDPYDETCAEMTVSGQDLTFQLRPEIMQNSARLEEIIVNGVTQLAVHQKRNQQKQHEAQTVPTSES